MWETSLISPYNLKLLKEDGVPPVTTDSVLLSAFPKILKSERIVDLGAGSGIISILLAAREPTAEVCAVEISEKSLSVLNKNVSSYGLSNRITTVRADYRNLKDVLPCGKYTLAAANPPYFPRGSGGKKADALLGARMEENGTVFDLLKASGRLLKTGGRAAVVFPAERIADLFLAMRESGIEPKRLQIVQHMAEKPPSLVLVEGKKGGRPGLRMETPLVLCDDSGYTDEYYRIYGRKR